MAPAKKKRTTKKRSAKKKKGKKKTRGARPLRKLAVVMTLVLVVGAYVGYEWATWPNVAALKKSRPETTAFIERHKAAQRAEGKKARVDRRWVPFAQISNHLKHAVLVSEDINFFGHSGFETDEMKAAVQDSLEKGKPLRGASTLTQQLAKNLWLSPSRNPLRKVREAILTRQLEESLSKRRILEIYLNVVEFGAGIYGAEAASQRYFSAAAAGLSREQAAQLAAVLPRPKSWRPGKDSDAYRKKVGTLLRRMDKTEWLQKRF